MNENENNNIEKAKINLNIENENNEVEFQRYITNANDFEKIFLKLFCGYRETQKEKENAISKEYITTYYIDENARICNEACASYLYNEVYTLINHLTTTSNLSEKDIKNAFRDLVERAKPYAPYKILAQKMSKGGVETILGGNTDEQFGKVVLIGLGGVYVEVFKDTALRLCPITRYDAEAMISQLKAKDLITHNGKATSMLVNLLIKFSKLFENSKVKEIDLNPVFVREDSYEVVDIRMIV